MNARETFNNDFRMDLLPILGVALAGPPLEPVSPGAACTITTKLWPARHIAPRCYVLPEGMEGCVKRCVHTKRCAAIPRIFMALQRIFTVLNTQRSQFSNLLVKKLRSDTGKLDEEIYNSTDLTLQQ